MKKFIFLLTALVLCCVLAVSAGADTNDDILEENQDLVVLGSVKNIEKDYITITVDHVLGRRASELVGKDIMVEKFVYSYCTKHIPVDFSNPIVSDNVVISLDANEDIYTMKNGAFKVDSNEYASCKIINHADEINEDCIKALAKITCYVRSDTKVNEFEFDDQGNIYAVYPQSMQQCIRVVDADGNIVVDDVVEEANPDNRVVPGKAPVEDGADKRWIYAIIILVAGAAAGVLVSYIYGIKRKSSN